MKGPFGMLLVGGGLILLIGLFTGKIQFPGASPQPPVAPSQTQVQKLDPKKPVLSTGQVPGSNTPIDTVIVCPPGQHPVHVGLRGSIACQAD